MCGIVAGVAERSLTPILLEGLRRLEYRGYDSAGVALIDSGEIRRARSVGKLAALLDKIEDDQVTGNTGVAHTRWATHGKPSDNNAHPHLSNSGNIALVHNGIIENHQALKQPLLDQGVTFHSETDTEVVVHLIDRAIQSGLDFEAAFRQVIDQIEGAYAIAAVSVNEPDVLMVARNGPPMVIGHGLGEHFAASDIYALLPVTSQFTILEDGDVAKLTRSDMVLWDHTGALVTREKITSTQTNDDANKQGFKHYMLKEIHEQPDAILNTIEGRLGDEGVLEGALGPDADRLLADITQVQIIACGTSSYAGMVARFWFEEIGLSTQVEVASEYRYREVAMQPNTLVVGISQSGETADTISALNYAREKGAASIMAICNAPESSITRLADLTLLTRAGREIGVASTKAFSAQLTALAILAAKLANYQQKDRLSADMSEALRSAPKLVNQALDLDEKLDHWAEQMVHQNNALFLGRGLHYPIALEGALKLKEISYIHAEAYPAGELKHGPLALVDETMPVVALAPQNELMEKLLSNLHEVEARGGQLYILAGDGVSYTAQPDAHVHVIKMPAVDARLSPLIYAIPLQLLAYKVALLRGTDVDQPRNLAKSVTVE